MTQPLGSYHGASHFTRGREAALQKLASVGYPSASEVVAKHLPMSYGSRPVGKLPAEGLQNNLGFADGYTEVVTVQHSEVTKELLYLVHQLPNVHLRQVL